MNHAVAAISSLDPRRLAQDELLVFVKMLEMKLEEARALLRRGHKK